MFRRDFAPSSFRPRRVLPDSLVSRVADALADPDAAFEISVKHYVKDLPQEHYATQRQVLTNSMELWRSEHLGQTNPAAWEATQDILIQSGLLEKPLDNLAACYNMDFLPQ